MKANASIREQLLRALAQARRPLGAEALNDYLQAEGLALQPRTVRFHLLQLDRAGLTRLVSRRAGRELTPQGVEELARSQVIDRMGFIGSHMDTLAYRVRFNPDTRRGLIAVSLALVRKGHLFRALEEMKYVFSRGLGMGSLVTVVREGGELAGCVVPRDHAALGTVSAVTLQGCLLAAGIALTPRYGGLLDMSDGKARQFAELIAYAGTTLDPLAIFMRARLTRIREWARTGVGPIGATVGEFPAVALPDVTRIARQLAAAGLGSPLAIGRPHQPLLGVPVAEDRALLVAPDGANPLAALLESGLSNDIRPLAGLADFTRFEPFHALRDRITS